MQLHAQRDDPAAGQRCGFGGLGPARLQDRGRLPHGVAGKSDQVAASVAAH